jgi:hypothetical protein
MRKAATDSAHRTGAFRWALRTEQGALRQQLDDGAPLGVAEILVAVFDVPDTAPAFGNAQRQVIDRGAFTAWLGATDGVMPFFLDHGDAHRYGAHSAAKMIGEVTGGEETDAGLLIAVQYDLEAQPAREAFTKLLKFPRTVGFSFADELEREVIEVRDGVQHVTEMWPFEASQVGFGAQARAHVVAARTTASRARSLDDLPNRIRGAWYEAWDVMNRALGGRTWVVGVYAEDDEAEPTRGYVIAQVNDADYLRVDWAAGDDDAVAFDTTTAKAMEMTWTERAAAVGELVALMRQAKVPPEQLAEAYAGATAPVVDPAAAAVGAFYEAILDAE